jgi:hypothetical protein
MTKNAEGRSLPYCGNMQETKRESICNMQVILTFSCQYWEYHFSQPSPQLPKS